MLLQARADILAAKGSQHPRLVGLFGSFRARTPQLYVDVDREKVKKMGGCRSATSSTRCRRTWAAATSTTSTASAVPGRSNVQAEPRYRTHAEAVRQLKVRNAGGCCKNA
jgi:multidrug efflux pump